jgi:hypothetical protein
MKAFPNGIITNDKGIIVGGQPGMDLRDYFAAAYLANEWCACDSPTLTAKAAYKVADAMMKVREE